MGSPLLSDDMLTRPGPHTGRRNGRIRIGLYIVRDIRYGTGPRYFVTCDCGETFRVSTAAVLGPRVAGGCLTCRRIASLEGNVDAGDAITRRVGQRRMAIALHNFKALAPQQQQDFALLMNGRVLSLRNIEEALTMARAGLSKSDREMFRPKSPQELRVEVRSHQGEQRTAFFREKMNVRHD